PVLVGVLLDLFGRGLEEVSRREVCEQTRLREDRDVGRVAALGARAELRLEVLAALVLDLDVVLFGPVGPRVLEQFRFVVDDRAVDGDGVAAASAVAASLWCAWSPATCQGDARCPEQGERSQAP